MLFFQIGQLPLQILQAAGAGIVRFFFQRGFFNLHLHQAAGNLIHLTRHGVDLGTDHRTGLIHQINRLIRQEAVGDVAVG
ncbi:hypothetical protein D3C80_1672890 [compost metagenome]